MVEVLEYVDGYGGIQDRAKVHMRGIRNLGQPGCIERGRDTSVGGRGT